MEKQHTYIAIDLKSFYASVECADRGLDSLTANLVVADESRTDKTICLAVSPALKKACGVSGRPRLFEVRQKVNRINENISDPARKISYIIATPRMARYVEMSRQIYSIYLNYIAPEDMHIYSIDEVFMDVTSYLDTYHMSARDLATTIIRDVWDATHVTATAGIGTNLYLAKIAMDIVAKHMAPDKNGVRTACLDEMSYRYLLWDHTPLTDFWRIGTGTARRLQSRNIFTMGDLARISVRDQEWLYRIFGVDAEILIDHAWGIEPCTIEDIRHYKPESNSICEGQVLSTPYPYDKARIVVREMTDSLMLQLAGKGLVTDSLTLDISYDRENVDNGTYCGEIHTDHYGRAVPRPVHGSARLPSPTNLGSRLTFAVLEIFDRIVDPNLSIRRICITAARVVPDEGFAQTELFSDVSRDEKEKHLQESVLSIRKKYGKNSLLHGTDYLDGATMRERNGQIGGHRA